MQVSIRNRCQTCGLAPALSQTRSVSLEAQMGLTVGTSNIGGVVGEGEDEGEAADADDGAVAEDGGALPARLSPPAPGLPVARAVPG